MQIIARTVVQKWTKRIYRNNIKSPDNSGLLFISVSLRLCKQVASLSVCRRRIPAVLSDRTQYTTVNADTI